MAEMEKPQKEHMKRGRKKLSHRSDVGHLFTNSQSNKIRLYSTQIREFNK